MDTKKLEYYKKAGTIAKETRDYAKRFIKEGVLLTDIAKKIHEKIHELGGMTAFPVNLSIDDIAAHYHPSFDDTTTASGLLKVDIGIHIKGCIADTAVTIDLTPEKKHAKLIAATERALESALGLLKKNPTIHEIGKTIQESISNDGFSPVVNLSGHSIEEYEIHAGMTIPNYGNNNLQTLEAGVYAIEPFATYGEGKIYEGKSGNIYSIAHLKNTRSPTGRKILEYVHTKYKTLPFSSTEIHEKFGALSRLAIQELEREGILQSHNQLIEKSHQVVAQAEHTFIKLNDGTIIVTTI
jgi:methionyl aminopeptidase